MTYVPFERANEVGERFLELLSNLGINPPYGSKVEDELLSLTELVDVVRDPNIASGSSEAEVLGRAAGLHDFAAKVLSAETLPEFEKFVPHLMKLGANADSFSTLIQNARAKLPNDTNRKLTELYVASLAIHLSDCLELDSPDQAKGDNPDIIFRYVGDKRCWALAIKSVSGASGQTYFERIQEAASQIDADACPADVGMILVNLKDTIDHDAIWSTPFPNLPTAIEALQKQIHDRICLSEKNRPQNEWEDLFQGKVVRPILFIAHSLARIRTEEGKVMPTALKSMVAFGAQGTPCSMGCEIAVGMNDMMQRVLLGTPGTKGVLPQ